MRIGIDFDNTIACYDGVFYAAALERGFIDKSIATDKNSVRDDMESRGLKEAFTELQGYVYGARMDLVSPYSGVLDFVKKAINDGHSVFIVSHKTKRPMLGPAYDMHEAARGFLQSRGFINEDTLRIEDTFFEETMELKVARAASLQTDVFIDDLPKILSMNGFPTGVRKLLFAPIGEGNSPTHLESPFETHSSWKSIAEALLV